MFLQLVAVISIAGWPRSSAAKDNPKADQEFAAISVNGRPLTGPNSTARKTARGMSLPVGSVGRALGDRISIQPEARRITVSRSDGTSAELDGRSGVISENGSTKLSLSNLQTVSFSADLDSVYLETELFAALFGASITFDPIRNTVTVHRGFATLGADQTQLAKKTVELHAVDYEYGLNRYSASTAHNLVLMGIGRVGDGRFRFSGNSSVDPRGLSIQNSSLEIERSNGHRYHFGDLTGGTELPLMTASLRGGSISIPFKDLTVVGFAGRTYSGSFAEALDRSFHPLRMGKYDTNIAGLTAVSVGPGRSNVPLTYSGGVMHFGSGSRSGSFGTGGIRLESSRGRLQADAAFGSFNSEEPGRARTSGYGAAADISATFNLSDDLAVHGRYTRVSKRFLSPQVGIREPLDLRSAGVTWSPKKWISSSINATTSKRPSQVFGNDRFITASLAVTPADALPRINLSHTESRLAIAGRSQFTTLNLVKDLERWRVFMNASRIKSLGLTTLNAQVGAAVTINDRNAIEASNGFRSRGSRNGQLDWRSSGMLGGRLRLAVGGGYHYSPSNNTVWFEKLTASIEMPRQTSMQVNLYNTAHGQTLLVSLKGSLFKKGTAGVIAESPVSAINSYGRIEGRVYQDVDMNGSYDPSTDKPLAAVKVRVDGNRYVETDEDGRYQFTTVSAGDHRVYLDLLSVRADLTLLSDGGMRTDLKAGHLSSQDFRLVRTGRVTGRLFYDANANGDLDEDEKPLADVRIFTPDGRDAMTDEDGVFTLSDLPPGVVSIAIDPATLPSKVVPAGDGIKIHVFSGRQTEAVLRAIAAPISVRHFPARSNEK